MPDERFFVVDGLCYLPNPSDAGYLRQARAAGVGAVHFTVAAVGDGADQALPRIGRWRRLVRENPDVAVLIERADDAERARQAGKLGVIFGWQDAAPASGNLDLLEAFHAAGLRIVQVTYQRQNTFGSGCGEGQGGRGGGLSLAGCDLVKRCNELGIALDVSHCGPRTSADVVEASAKPVFVTHTSCASMSGSVRAKSDELIRAVAEKGGVVGILSYTSILTDDFAERAAGRPAVRGSRRRVGPTVDLFIDHVERVIELAGEDHVSMGLDFTPGWAEPEYDAAAVAYPEIYRGLAFGRKHVAGLESIDNVPALIGRLKSRGHKPATIRKVVGGNFLRVFRAACG